MNKYYSVFAGVNGAGKSTLYHSKNSYIGFGRVNADEILREFGGDWKDQRDQFKSGKIALARIKEYFEKGISFTQETTLASKNVIRNARKARELGYITEMQYVGLDSADLAIKRISKRVSDGGHGIPDDIVRQRYEISLKNLKEAIEVFNTVYVYDNTNEYTLIAIFYNGMMIGSVDDFPEWFRKALN